MSRLRCYVGPGDWRPQLTAASMAIWWCFSQEEGHSELVRNGPGGVGCQGASRRGSVAHTGCPGKRGETMTGARMAAFHRCWEPGGKWWLGLVYSLWKHVSLGDDVPKPAWEGWMCTSLYTLLKPLLRTPSWEVWSDNKHTVVFLAPESVFCTDLHFLALLELGSLSCLRSLGCGRRGFPAPMRCLQRGESLSSSQAGPVL